MKLRRFNLIDAALLICMGLAEDCLKLWRERRGA